MITIFETDEWGKLENVKMEIEIEKEKERERGEGFQVPMRAFSFSLDEWGKDMKEERNVWFDDIFYFSGKM